MFEPVPIPLWLVVLAGLLAFVGLLDRIIGPGFRWFFRRKANQAIEEVNERLRLRIQPFKTTRRQALIDRLLFDAAIVSAVEIEADETGEPRDVVQARAERYAREIVPAFNAYAYFTIGTRLARFLSRLLYRVRLAYADEQGLSDIDPEATVVFVMNHRSNMDYVLVTYLASTSASLSYAVGEWARVWPLQNLIRAMGAFFIRRDSGNKLYRRVLARYVAMATESGVTQAMFPEGGLTTDGALRAPKFGLLGYMLAEFDPKVSRDVVFVPVGVNYDRVMEDRILISNHLKKSGQDVPPSQLYRFGFGELARFLGHLIVLRIRGRLFRYGYAGAGFGTPVSLKAWLAQRGDEVDRHATVEALGRALMSRVGEVVPVLPVALVASVFARETDARLTELQMKVGVSELIDRLESDGVHVHVPRQDRDYAITTGLRMLTLRHLIVEDDGLYRVAEGEAVIIDYYANSIAHLLKP